MRDLTVDMIVDGVVTGIQPYGAFVQLEGGRTGLIHISEISDAFVRDVNDFVKIGGKVRARIIGVDEASGQISLSIKEFTKNRFRKERINRQRKPLVMKIGFKTIEAMLPIWIAETMKEIDDDQV